MTQQLHSLGIYPRTERRIYTKTSTPEYSHQLYSLQLVTGHNPNVHQQICYSVVQETK